MRIPPEFVCIDKHVSNNYVEDINKLCTLSRKIEDAKEVRSLTRSSDSIYLRTLALCKEKSIASIAVQ